MVTAKPTYLTSTNTLTVTTVTMFPERYAKHAHVRVGAHVRMHTHIAMTII